MDEKFFSKFVKNSGTNAVNLVLPIISLSHEQVGQAWDKAEQEKCLVESGK
jgi:hypothetical protein